jgi:hypothetical protein
MLQAGRSRSYVDREPIEELGFDFFAWTNVYEKAFADIYIRCGAYGYASNHCMLFLPGESPVREQVLQIPVLLKIMRCIISALEPSYVVVNSLDYLFRPPGLHDGETPAMGWLIYLPIELEQVPALPAPARVVPVDWDKHAQACMTHKAEVRERDACKAQATQEEPKAGGVLVIVTGDEIFTARNPEHVKLADGVGQLLLEAGLLHSDQ